MNKSQLIRAFAEQESISLEESANVINTFFNTIKSSLKNENRVEIRGFGSFKIKRYEGYLGRNPSTGEMVQVKPKKLPFFRLGKDLKEYLNQ